MSIDRFSRVCLLVIAFLLVLIVVRPALAPSSARGEHYSYKLVKVNDDDTAEQSRKALEKHTGEGWELVAAPFFPGPKRIGHQGI